MWITLAEFDTIEDAYIVKGMLEENGVPVQLENTTISSVYPMTLSWAPIILKVPEESAVLASKLIK